MSDINKVVNNLGVEDLANGGDDIATVKQLISEKVCKIQNSCNWHMLIGQLMKNLSLEFGKKERDAWDQRNIVAHGRKTENAKIIQQIEEVKTLRTLCHRILLSMMKISDFYIDYSTLGHPIKKLKLPEI